MYTVDFNLHAMNNFYYCGVYYLRDEPYPAYFIYWNEEFEGKNSGRTYVLFSETPYDDAYVVNRCSWVQLNHPSFQDRIVDVSTLGMTSIDLPFDLIDKVGESYPKSIRTFRHLQSLDELIHIIGTSN